MKIYKKNPQVAYSRVPIEQGELSIIEEGRKQFHIVKMQGQENQGEGQKCGK